MEKIAQGKVEGVSIDTLSLDLLKKYYGEVKGTNDRQNYYGFNPSSMYKLFNQLNIKQFGHAYGRHVAFSNPVLQLKKSQAKKEFNQTEEGQRIIAQKNQKRHEFNQTEEGQRIIKLNALSKKLTWYFNPEIRDKMSNIYAENFSKLPANADYLKLCDKTMPDYKQETIGAIDSLMYKELKDRIQKTEENNATDDDLTILSGYYILTKAQAPEYSDCFSDIEDKLLENENTYSEAINIMTDYYKNVQEKYPEEIADKYFSGLKKILEDEKIKRK